MKTTKLALLFLISELNVGRLQADVDDVAAAIGQSKAL